VKAAKRKKGRVGMTVSIGAEMFKGATYYAGFVLYGWLTGRRGSQNRKKIPGTKWANKAFEQSKPAAFQRIIEKLGEEFEKYAGQQRIK
jgi:hypothetical protein